MKDKFATLDEEHKAKDKKLEYLAGIAGHIDEINEILKKYLELMKGELK